MIPSFKIRHILFVDQVGEIESNFELKVRGWIYSREEKVIVRVIFDLGSKIRANLRDLTDIYPHGR